jgi:hypothetical protein
MHTRTHARKHTHTYTHTHTHTHTHTQAMIGYAIAALGCAMDSLVWGEQTHTHQMRIYAQTLSSMG